MRYTGTYINPKSLNLPLPSLCPNKEGSECTAVYKNPTKQSGWEIYRLWVAHGPVSGRLGKCFKGASHWTDEP